MNRDLQAFRKFLIVPFVENPVNTPISDEQRNKLEKLLELDSERKIAPLTWLRKYNGKSSPEEFLETINKIETIRKINLQINLDLIPANKLISFVRVGKKYENFSFKRFEEAGLC